FSPSTSAADASLILESKICEDNGGHCALTGCWIRQKVGECNSNGKSQGSCCVTSDQDAQKIQASHIQSTIKDPILQNQALSSIRVSAGTSANPSLNYTLLEKLPGIDSTNLSFSAYLSAIYKLAIWIVGLCALFMFLVGAFMYMLSAANTSKMGSAKSIMQDALIGLVLALASYLILYVINPDLVNLKLPTVSRSGTGGASTPGATAPMPTAGTGSGCGGLSVSGINNSQCNDASQPLSDLLACIHEKYPSARITSISDSAGFSNCKNNWSKPPCAHAQTSCHYGGGVSQRSDACNKSHAADFSVKNSGGGMDLSIVESLKQAGNACGGRVNDETAGPYPHIHISDQTNCCSL
ncbi:MAG: pilin, partial [Candidatus Moraniibacteriota bacterium]